MRPPRRWPAKLGEFRVEVDDSDETVGKRIRNAEVEKIPYVLVWGDKESEGAIAVRTHGGEQSTKSLDELLSELAPGCYGVTLQSRGNMFLTSGAASLSGVQPRRLERIGPLLRSGLVI